MGELAAAPQNIQHTIATTTASGMNLEIGYRRFRKLPFVNLYQKVNSRLCVLHPSDPPLWLSKRLRWVDGWLAGWLVRVGVIDVDYWGLNLGITANQWARKGFVNLCSTKLPEGQCGILRLSVERLWYDERQRQLCSCWMGFWLGSMSIETGSCSLRRVHLIDLVGGGCVLLHTLHST